MVRLLDQVMVPRVPTRKERTEIERMDHRTAQPNQARVCAESTVYTGCVEPQGIELVARHGETVIAAAERLGWRWPTICHGDGECSVCWVKVIGGSAHISPMSEDERATLELLPSSIIDKNDSSPVRLRLPSPDSWRRHRGQEGGSRRRTAPDRHPLEDLLDAGRIGYVLLDVECHHPRPVATPRKSRMTQ